MRRQRHNNPRHGGQGGPSQTVQILSSGEEPGERALQKSEEALRGVPPLFGLADTSARWNTGGAGWGHTGMPCLVDFIVIGDPL